MDQRWDSKFELKPGRWVFVPNTATLVSGREIKDDLQHRWKAPANYYHLRDGGHVAALKTHSGHQYFVHVDIKDFFGSINRSRVTRALKGLYSYSEARKIADSSTVRFPGETPPRFIWPYGFPQSTILASICLRKSALGNFLKRAAMTSGTTISVYVDDIVMSFADQVSADNVFAGIVEVANKSGFEISPEKIQGPAPIIKAFNIELSQTSLAISPERFQKFVDAIQESKNKNQIDAIIGYVSTVNAPQSAMLENCHNE